MVSRRERELFSIRESLDIASIVVQRHWKLDAYLHIFCSLLFSSPWFVVCKWFVRATKDILLRYGCPIF